MKISEEIEVPVALNRLQGIIEEFMRVSDDLEAEVTFRRVGRESSPLELMCEWPTARTSRGPSEQREE